MLTFRAEGFPATFSELVPETPPSTDPVTRSFPIEAPERLIWADSNATFVAKTWPAPETASVSRFP